MSIDILARHIDRPAFYFDSSPMQGGSPLTRSSFIPFAIEEAAIRAISPVHRRRRRETFGDSALHHPLQTASLFLSDVRKGPLIEVGQRGAGGLRVNLARTTEYGAQHEEALQSNTPHDWDHLRRLYDLTEHIQMQPEVKLSDSVLYLIPSQWILIHDEDQSNSEFAKRAKPKWAHDDAAAMHARVYRDRVREATHLSEDEARLVTGANAALMFYHDEPKTQQRLLDAMERSESRRPYEDIIVDGNAMRRYMTAQELRANLEDADQDAIDLLAITDWQLADLLRTKKSQIAGFVTPETPFGLYPAFERSFSQELAQIAQLPDGAIVDDTGHVVVDLQTGEEKALVPERLLTAKLRIDIAFLGDILRIADIFDMAPPGLGLVRKLQVPMNWERRFYRPTLLEDVLSGTSVFDAEGDSIIRRAFYETNSVLDQIQRRPEQLRPALEDIRYVRDTAYKLHNLNVRALQHTMPILMMGDESLARQEITRILMDEHTRMQAKLLRSRGLTDEERQERITAALEETMREIDYTMGCMSRQLDPLLYSDDDRRDVVSVGNRLLEVAEKQYHERYGRRGRTSPGRPYSTWQSSRKQGGLTRVRTLFKPEQPPLAA